MSKDTNWGVVNDIVTGVGAFLTLVGIFTSFKASNYIHDREDKRLEEKYGLEAVQEEN